MAFTTDSAGLVPSLPSEVAQARGLAEPSMAGVGDYLALLKPRVMSLVVFTALVGMVVAPTHMHPVLGFFALLCIAIGAGAAGALNMWYDADIDALMKRTAQRPIPAGRVTRGEAHDVWNAALQCLPPGFQARKRLVFLRPERTHRGKSVCF